MICPFCGSDEIKVIKTITQVENVIRYRLCLNCTRSFSTNETIRATEPYLKKYNEIYKTKQKADKGLFEEIYSDEEWDKGEKNEQRD